GLTVLAELDAEAYARLETIATSLATGLSSAFADAGVAVQVPRVGPLVGLFFSGTPIVDFPTAKVSADTGLYRRFFRGMLDRGVALAPGAYEAMFPSLAHAAADIDATVAAAAEVAASLS
ncbi:MAG: aspartate aminotransferase family protein, partial [Acidimicrobiia bacterium]|nr:aspartate aminotransferase family protein [Acidimicrobiia bacterium]